MKLLRPNNQIDVWQILEERLAAGLGHATEKSEHDMRPFFGHSRQHSHFPERLLVSPIADTAGVEQHDVRFRFVLSPLIAALHERMCDLFRVTFVHLASIGLDKKSRHVVGRNNTPEFLKSNLDRSREEGFQLQNLSA